MDSVVVKMDSVIVKPVIPIAFINMMVKDACVLNRDKKVFQFKWNKFTQTYEVRWIFRPSYQKRAFTQLIRCLSYKRQECHQPSICSFLVYPVRLDVQPPSYHRRPYCITPEERKKWVEETTTKLYEFATQLCWGIKYEFDEYETYISDGDQEYSHNKFKYTYYYFENGMGGYNCAFIEDNACEDDEDYVPLFNRAYVSIDDAIFPFFKEPISQFAEYPYQIDQKPAVTYLEIPFLNKERGMKVYQDRLYGKYISYPDETGMYSTCITEQVEKFESDKLFECEHGQFGDSGDSGDY